MSHLISPTISQPTSDAAPIQNPANSTIYEQPNAPAPVLPRRWSATTRLAFRFAFCYFLIYALCCGNATLWIIFPFHIGEHINNFVTWPFQQSSQWIGQHLFHLTGVAGTPHGGGSGDRAIDWIAIGVMLALAILATLLWTAIDELLKSPRPAAYHRLFFWFRLILRVTLGIAMLFYGMDKLFPLQMAPPSLAVLNEPLGNTSPMTMLWTLIGMNPVYEMICGAAEVTAGILILFRRTSLLGTLLTAFLATNIVLYNFCFDVPVKIYAAHLLFMSLVLLAPDLRTLFNFFLLHRPTPPTERWRRPAWRYGLRFETVCAVIILLLAAVPFAIGAGHAYAHQLSNAHHPPPLTGQWHLDTATKPFVTGDASPMADIFFEPTGRAMIRSSDGVLWRAGADINDKRHTLQLFCTGREDAPTYAMTQPDPSHLTLTPTGKDAAKDGTLTLTRVPLPTHYPLLDRGFHFVNEWGLER